MHEGNNYETMMDDAECDDEDEWTGYEYSLEHDCWIHVLSWPTDQQIQDQELSAVRKGKGKGKSKGKGKGQVDVQKNFDKRIHKY